MQVSRETADAADPVPPGLRFDVVWRGYNRRQVNEFVNIELGFLAADRNAATTLVSRLVKLLNESRSETWCLRERLDRLCRTPLSPDAVGERLRRNIELARAEASDIVTRARARGEHIRAVTAEEIARLEESAERRRQRIEQDFQTALAARRAETMRNLQAYESACRAEANRLLSDARVDAARQLASARHQVRALQGIHRDLARRLRTVRDMFIRTYALIDPAEREETWHSTHERETA